MLVNLVSRVLQSTTAKNLKLVRDASGLNPQAVWTSKVKVALHENSLVDIPLQDVWKLQFLQSLLGQLQIAKQLVQEENINYIQGLINSLVI